MKTYRTHHCAQLRKNDIGEKVHLSGWVHRRRDHGGLIFIDLRDEKGLTQLVFDPDIDTNAHDIAQNLRSEWVIHVQGKVCPRAEGQNNPKLQTGDIEIECYALDILSKAKTPPFSIADEFIDVHEELRLKYRYLDIRRGQILSNLKLRHQAMQEIRTLLNKHHFTEITTPILGKSTPEGARDYLVPSRVHPGNFYALPQSPQIFKQLLMMSGIDRYFQIAPCFRDEDLRSDRQPEFTQIDIEMSFSDPEELMSIIEKLFKQLFEHLTDKKVSLPFKRLSHNHCMEHYGTDRPDLRFDMKFVRIDEIAKQSEFSVFKQQLDGKGCIKAICVPGGAQMSRREIDALADFVKPFGLQGLAWMKYTEEGLHSSITKFFSKDLLKQIKQETKAKEGDLLLFAASHEKIVNQALDHLRRKLAVDLNMIDKNRLEFLWVVDFPLFQYDSEEDRLVSEHHPFTHPKDEDIAKLETDPLSVSSLAYDIVLNGYELGGGSKRIHDMDMQEKIFKALKLTEEEIKEKFGFFVDALSHGTPPHLGIALGLDRIIMLLCETENIRDVIAFPKTQKASDLMLLAPSNVANKQLHDLQIKLDK